MLKDKLIYPELSYKINGLCFKTHNELGQFAREKQYADRLEQLLIENQIKYQREIKIPFILVENIVSGNKADFIIEDKIVLECKSRKFISKNDYYQVQRYLQALNLKLGIIVNFRTDHLRPKRIIKYS